MSRIPESTRKELRNEDPISGEKGAHPVGTGLGAAVGGAATGAIAGAVAGPVGTVVGTVIGGVAGALAGKSIAEDAKPTLDLDFWQKHLPSRSYFDPKYKFEDFEPAYRLGWDSSHRGLEWSSVEGEIREKWELDSANGKTMLTWEETRMAAKDAFDRAQWID